MCSVQFSMFLRIGRRLTGYSISPQVQPFFQTCHFATYLKHPLFEEKKPPFVGDVLDPPSTSTSTSPHKHPEHLLDPEEFKPNTVFPKSFKTKFTQTATNSNQFLHIKPENLVYIPKYNQQLNPSFYLSSSNNTKHTNNEAASISANDETLLSQSENVILYEYADSINKSDYMINLKQTIAFGAVTMGIPTFLYFYTMSSPLTTYATKLDIFNNTTNTVVTVLSAFGAYFVMKHLKNRVKLKKEPFISKIVLICEKMAKKVKETTDAQIEKNEYSLELTVQPGSFKKGETIRMALNPDVADAINNTGGRALSHSSDMIDYYNLNRYISLLPVVGEDGKQYV